jgi:6-phosphogluconolactonase
MPEIHVFPSPETLAEAASARVAAALREAVAARGRASLVLTGGSAPGPVYRRLTREPLDWGRVHVFWGDERCVPPDDPESNYRLARETLLDAVPIPPDQVHRMACEDAPGEAAHAYAETLRAFFGSDETRFDVTLLGMGEDGHVASLFPGSGAVEKRDEWVLATEAPPSSPVAQRLTLTLPLLNASRLVLFLVTGAKKRATLRRVLSDGEAGDLLPAALVRPEGTLAWYVDEAAKGAGDLPGSALSGG